MLARALVDYLEPRYDSQAEAWWAAHGAFIIGAEYGSPTVLTQYHPLTFRVPGGHYTPDFLHILQDGRMVQVEVKGSKQQRNYRDARSKLRAAAEMYGWCEWCEARVAGGSFVLERIEAHRQP